MRFLALAFALALVACGGKSKPATTPTPDPAPAEPTGEPTGEPAATTPKPTPSDAELEAMFAKTLELFETLGPAVEAAGQDCAKMATAMEGVLGQYESLLAEARSYEGNAEDDAKADAYFAERGDRLQKSLAKMGPGLSACSEDAEVKRVMARFEL